jgi:hypothetical protein
MKKLLTTGFLVGLAVSALAQGQINLDNLANTSTSPTASSNGLFFFDPDGPSGPVLPALANTDFNVSFYGGSDASSLVLLRTFAGSTATGGNGFGPGTFTDPQGVAATIQGATTTGFFRIDAWTGTATDYSGTGGTLNLRGSSGVFSNPIAVAPNTPPDFTSMPAVVLNPVPEPSTFALAGLGAAALLIFRRRK